MKKTSKNNYIILWLAIMLCSVTVLSCSQWDDYKKYTKDGEIIYTGKFDTAIIYPGKERVRLYGLLMADPKIAKCKIFWNSKSDSIEFDIIQDEGNNVFDKTFNVDEGVKSFTIFTYDDLGNPSVAVNAIGASYGARYRNKLSNRRIKSIDYYTNKAVIHWDPVDMSVWPIQTELTYTTPSGNNTIVTPISENSTEIPGYQYNLSTYSFSTVFKPEPNGIDTFHTTSISSTPPVFVNKEIPKSLFNVYNLSGDAVKEAGGTDGGVAKMWEGNTDYAVFRDASFTKISDGLTTPQMVSFDMGIPSKLTSIKIWPFKEWTGLSYSFSTMRRFEIWGSEAPSASGALDESWKLLVSDTLIKPSNLPYGTEDAADAQAARDGFTFSFDSNNTIVRYIRIRCLQNYEGYKDNNDKAFFSVAEIKVYGLLPK